MHAWLSSWSVLRVTPTKRVVEVIGRGSSCMCHPKNPKQSVPLCAHREVMQEAWETIKAMREEFQEQNNIYWAAEQEFRTWRNVDRERKCGATLMATFIRHQHALRRWHQFGGHRRASLLSLV